MCKFSCFLLISPVVSNQFCFAAPWADTWISWRSNLLSLTFALTAYDVLTILFGYCLYILLTKMFPYVLVSVILQLNTTQFLPILLVHPLVLLLTPSSVLFGDDFLFFARPLAFFFFLFISTEHSTGEQYPKAVLTNPLGKAGWCIGPRNTLFCLLAGRWWLFQTSCFPCCLINSLGTCTISLSPPINKE